MGWRTRLTALVGTLVLTAVVTTGTAQADGHGHGHDGPGHEHGEDRDHRRGSLRDLQHIVVLMQENRSFDSYFGQLHDEGQRRSDREPTRGNPDPTNPNGPNIKPFHATDLCTVADLNHEWTGTHLEYDGGRMDGFTVQNVDPKDPTGSRTMGYFDQSDLPFYYSLANTFGVGDRNFASVLGPTYPNRFYEMTGTSFGHIRNDFPPAGGYTQPTIFGRLQAAGISWKVYYALVPTASFFADVQAHPDHLAPIAQYYADAKAGTLPQVAFVEPRYIGDVTQEADEHPPSNPQVGQQFTSTIVNALMASPNWSSSAFILTYDEHGGYYDHVAPPRAPKPDDIPPMLKPGDINVGFDRFGIRVPFVMVSPFSRPHFVSHDVQDHTSILKLIETRFGLQPLTQRDAHADNLLDYFDFDHPHFLKPPTLATATIDPVRAAKCAADHPGILGL
jgi:phospholipase C